MSRYTSEDKELIFKQLTEEDVWVEHIFNSIKDENTKIYYFHLTTRTTEQGKSNYTDILGYSDNKIEYLNNLIDYFNKYGTIVSIHVDEGLKEGDTALKSINNKDINFKKELEYQDIYKIIHNNFSYQDTIDFSESNKTYENIEKNINIYLKYCFNAEGCSYGEYFLHYISISIGKNSDKSNNKKLNYPYYYGFGSVLFFITNKKDFSKSVHYELSRVLNEQLLSRIIRIINIAQTNEEQKRDALKSNKEIINEMKEISKHVDKARTISKRVQAKLDNFGKVFYEWYTEGMEKVFTTGSKLGKYFTFNNKGIKQNHENVYGQHLLDNDYKDYIKRLIASTNPYFNPEKRGDYPFIDCLVDKLNNLDKDQKTENIKIIKKIKDNYRPKNINHYFPIGLLLFFFNNKYYIDAIIEIKNTDISSTAILNGLDKLFVYNEIKPENRKIEINNDYLKIKLHYQGDAARGLLGSVIHHHNKEPYPHHRTTTYMIRQLMGIGEKNYDSEDFAKIDNNTYCVGKNTSPIKAYVKDGIFILEYSLYKIEKTGKA